ncbi:MAG TPA: histidine kinase [Holophagaceae bacterium]|nr:histidine kinase [Holophagaceae bacterium]
MALVWNNGRFWRNFALAWAMGVVYFTSQDLAYLPMERSQWLHLLSMNALQITVWGLLVLPALAFLKRWPLEGPGRLKHWCAFAPMVLFLVFLGLWAAFVISLLSARTPAFGGPGYHARLVRFFTLYFHFYFLTFLSVLFAYHAYIWRQRFRDGALQSSQLEAKLFQAKNQALRMQLQPHFLFNTLHSISTLMHTDVEAADRMITRLGDLLRLSLDRNGEQEISLRQELAFLGAYLEIEHIRFKDRLQVSVEVPEALKEALLPTFILQPLVENALKHGFSKRSKGGAVAIRAREEAGSLRLEVEDDGEGPPAFPHEGVGLRSVRERLHLLYGELGQFTFGGLPGRGTLAVLILPLRRPGPSMDGAAS